jgi:dolichol-phosphate mannosyltransferase
VTERDVVAIMACYNTRERTREVLARFRAASPCDLVVVDDGSDDGTGGDLACGGYPLIRHARNRGLGAAIKSGLGWAREHGYGAVVVMAGNGKDDPVEIPRLIAPLLDGFDYVQGSRFLPGGRAIHLPWVRHALVRAHAALIRVLTGFPATDAANGFRAYRLSLVGPSGVDVWQEWLDGYEMESYLHYRVLTSGCRVIEVPVSKTYPPRGRGRRYSHVRPIVDWWAVMKPVVLIRLSLCR